MLMSSMALGLIFVATTKMRRSFGQETFSRACTRTHKEENAIACARASK